MGLIVTVVVCTYNRSELLQECLDALERQTAKEFMEVIVVDNNSTDNTREVVHLYEGRAFNIRYVLETAQGLSHARNRGISEACGTYIAYIDDDARASRNWVEQIIMFFNDYPGAAAVGGPYSAFSMVSIPAWFPNEYGSWSLGDKTRVLNDNEWINGTNMVFSRDVLNTLHGFDTSIGMCGDQVSYGEETNLVRRIRARNLSVYYCPSLNVEHAILPYKLSLRWLLKSSYLNGCDGVKTHCYEGSWIGYVPKLLMHFIVALIRFPFIRDRYIKTRIYHALTPFIWRCGFFSKLIDK